MISLCYSQFTTEEINGHIFVVPLLTFLEKNLRYGNVGLKISDFIIVLDTFCQIALEKGLHIRRNTCKALLHSLLENTRQDHNLKTSIDVTENRVAHIYTGGLLYVRLYSCFTLTFHLFLTTILLCSLLYR